MRIPVLLTGLLAVGLAATPLQRAPAQDDNAGGGDVSFDLFYNNLADDGDWYNTPEYGYVWQPFIAYKTDSWRPYSDGYWAQTDSGWTWVSYENFGWATYHYGRWTRLKDIGWAWVPGYQWGPGWVSWRTSDDYVGWAPLPPKVERGVYEGKVVDRRPADREVSVDYNDVEPEDDGYTSNVDQDYDIGPANYCFVGVGSFGAPVLSEVLLPPQQNVTIIEGTRNVTNIYYNHESNNVFVYNGGPRYDFISAHSRLPIQQLQIERVRNPSYLEEGLRAGGNPTQVRGGILQVAAPLIARRPVNFQQMKPAHVKQTIERPEVVHGWSNTGANPEVVQQLHNRFKEQAQQAPVKAEAPKERVVQPLPPEQRVVTRQPAPLPANGANGQPKDTSPEAVAARRAQRQQERTTQAEQERTTQAGQPGQPGQPRIGTPAQPLTDADRIARRNAAQQARDARNKQTNGQPAPAQAGQPVQPGQAAPNNGQPKDTSPEAVAARRAQRQQERAGQPGAKTPEQAAQPKDTSDEAKAARRAQRQQERAAQPQAQPQQAAPQTDAERDARRAQRQQEKAPEPTAQPAAKTPEQGGQPKDTSDEAKAARRAQRQQERAAQQAQPQAAQPQQANQEREARQAQRQPAQPQQANPERETRQAQHEQAQPQAQPAQQGNAQSEAQHAEKQGDKDKDKKDKPNQ